jgi:signal peptidase I
MKTDKNGKEIKVGDIIEYKDVQYKIIQDEKGLNSIEILNNDSRNPIYNLRKEFWSKSIILSK